VFEEAPMLVCHCRGVTDRQLRSAVKDGAGSVREVARATGAGLRCGGCRSAVSQVVNEAVEQELQDSRVSLRVSLTTLVTES
jgi:bacterioferritin-associated ferredoxin